MVSPLFLPHAGSWNDFHSFSLCQLLILHLFIHQVFTECLLLSQEPSQALGIQSPKGPDSKLTTSEKLSLSFLSRSCPHLDPILSPWLGYDTTF